VQSGYSGCWIIVGYSMDKNDLCWTALCQVCSSLPLRSFWVERGRFNDTICSHQSIIVHDGICASPTSLLGAGTTCNYNAITDGGLKGNAECRWDINWTKPYNKHKPLYFLADILFVIDAPQQMENSRSTTPPGRQCGRRGTRRRMISLSIARHYYK
jgi:hypothetical protein